VRRRERSGRSRVTVNKKRGAETFAQPEPLAGAPFSGHRITCEQANDHANRAPKIDARLSQRQQSPQSSLPACSVDSAPICDRVACDIARGVTRGPTSGRQILWPYRTPSRTSQRTEGRWQRGLCQVHYASSMMYGAEHRTGHVYPGYRGRNSASGVRCPDVEIRRVRLMAGMERAVTAFNGTEGDPSPRRTRTISAATRLSDRVSRA
jgi:hypothetical protein